MTLPPAPDEEGPLSALSHSLKDPLQGIVGYLELVEIGRYGEVEGELREALGRISTHARRLVGRLDVAMGLMPLACEAAERRSGDATAPAGPAEQAVRRAAEEAEERGVRLECLVDAGLPPVPGRADRLAIMFLALLRMALIENGDRHLRLRGDPEADGGVRFYVDSVPDEEKGADPGHRPSDPGEDGTLERTVLHLLAPGLGGRVEWPQRLDGPSGPVLHLPVAPERS
jgi:hypothetical protein